MKNLIIIVYKINVESLDRQQAEQYLHDIMKAYNFSQDEELKENYIIREIYLPVEGESTDVKIIYPIPRYTTSPEINELVSEISDKIKENSDSEFKQSWEALARELKLRRLETC